MVSCGSNPQLDIYVTNVSTATEEELSEEDQQLKNELDMMVERLTVRLVQQNAYSRQLIGRLTQPRNQTHRFTSQRSRL
jgi:hypothetical protein